MNFYIMTLFPEMVMDGLNTSIIGRAVNKGLLSIEALNIRDYAFNKHHSVDDYPYGGGAGMLMQAEPVYQCYDALARQITERKAKATEEKLASGEKKEMSGEAYQSHLSVSAGKDIQPVHGRGICTGRRSGIFVRSLRRH